MTSIIKLNVISGALDESPPCYILQVDDVRILLDCGWDENFDQEFIKEISRHVKYIDIVLLSFPDPMHLGALPYLVGKCGLSCPIYATIPVYKMGQLFMYDLYQSRYNNEDFNVFNLDEVDAAFDKIIQLKYNQTVILKGKCHGISIVPMHAGHMIGGTVWKITKVGIEDIIYAVEFNHKNERHLNGCLFEKIKRPSLLITNSYNKVYKQESRRSRDEKLMTNILQTFRNNGNVLIAVDTAGRILELAHMLDQLWGNKNSGLQNHSLCLLSNVSYNVIKFAKSQIEWMSDKFKKTFESSRYNPFHFKYIRTCHSLADIYKISAGKLVLASMPDLECGFGRNLCLEWISDPANSIILTTRTNKDTLARELIDFPINQKFIHVTIKRREKLTDEELTNYRRTIRQPTADIDSSDSDDVQIVGNIRKNHDYMVKTEKKKKKRKSNNRTYAIFPFEDIKKKYDEYGDIIMISDYVKEVKEINKNENKIEEDFVDIIEHPTKCVSCEKNIEIKASVQFIEFEGRADGESIHKLILNVHPRTVILVRAPKNETDTLAKYLRKLSDITVFTPSKGDTVDATTEAHIYQIRLTDALTSSLVMQQGDNTRLELAWVDSVANVYNRNCDEEMYSKNNYNERQSEKVIEQEEGATTTLMECDDLVLEPLCFKSDIIPHPTIFVNDVKLSKIKQAIAKYGIDCEFSGGVLLCANKTVAIHRESRTALSVRGTLSEEYFKVRSALYCHYAIL